MGQQYAHEHVGRQDNGIFRAVLFFAAVVSHEEKIQQSEKNSIHGDGLGAGDHRPKNLSGIRKNEEPADNAEGDDEIEEAPRLKILEDVIND